MKNNNNQSKNIIEQRMKEKTMQYQGHVSSCLRSCICSLDDRMTKQEEERRKKGAFPNDLLCSSLSPCNLSLFASCCAFFRSRQALNRQRNETRKNNVRNNEHDVFSSVRNSTRTNKLNNNLYRLAILFFSFFTSAVSFMFVCGSK
jgi:hypothetical protein